MTIATGSSTDRAVHCRASCVLPRAWAESTDYAEAGTAKHDHFQRVADGMAAEESLAKVPEAHREECAAIDLADLAGEMRLTPEIAFAYNPVTDTARVIGKGIARDYSTVTDDELPMTLDLAGLAGDVGIVGDYKTGWRALPPAADNWQMRGGALAVSRAFGVDEVDARLIYVRDGRVARRDRATFGALDLLGFAAELGAVWKRAQADRVAYAAGAHVEPTEGPWCRYCPSAWSCPARTGLIKSALAGELSGPVRAMDVPRLLPRVTDAIKALGAVKAQIMAMAASEPILMDADGDSETWLGEVVGEGNEKLDPTIAIEVAVSVLGVAPDQLAEFQREAASFEVTKSGLEAAVKKRAAPRQGAPTMKKILDGVRARNGAHRPTKRSVETYTIQRKKAANE